MNNVLIIGCGPVGIETACILATNRELKITVIDELRVDDEKGRTKGVYPFHFKDTRWG